MFEKEKDVLTVQQVASLLAISEAKVYDLIHSGELISRKIGRIYRVRKVDLLGFLNTGET